MTTDTLLHADPVAHITLVDVITVAGPGGTIDGRHLAGDQPKVCFAYLLLHRDSPVPPDRLGDAVWGPTRPATWQPALRALVSKARAFVIRAVPDAVVTARAAGYLLDLGGEADVDLERARACARLAEEALDGRRTEEATGHAADVAAITTGTFLPRVGTPWAEQVRDELVDLRLRALHVLGEVHLLRGEPERAVRTGHEAVALAPLHEAGHRLVLRALADAGEPGEAAQAFARCRQVLRDELGISPSKQTTDLFTSIIRD